MDFQPHADHALAKLRFRLEAETLSAMVDLNLPHGFAAIEEAKRVLDHEAPLFVNTISITGETSRNMYDDHPGLAYYQTTNTYTFEAPPYCGLAKGRELAESHMKKMVSDYKENANSDQDGTFYPYTMTLLDHANRPLQSFGRDEEQRKNTWLTPVAPEKTVELASKALTMNHDANEEIRGDNFESARHLRNQAIEFIAQASASKLHARAVP